MLRFPRLLILLLLAGQAQAIECRHDRARAGGVPFALGASGAARQDFIAVGSAASGAGSQFVAIPEPGVFVALISGATILLARRRR